MQQKKTINWIIAALFISIIPLIWYATRITEWEPEIFGVYTLNRMLLNLFITAVSIAAVYYLIGKKDRRTKILTIFTTFISLLICVFLLEVPSMFLGFDYQKIFGTGTTKSTQHLSEGVNKPDPVLIHIHWPNGSFTGQVHGNLSQLGMPKPPLHYADVKYDNDGFRNDRNYTQADIVVIGDSFVEAAIIPLDKSLVKLLERSLDKPTVNLGQIAYGFKQELEVLKRFALPKSPKVVIWALFGGNDLRDVEYYEDMLKHYGAPEKPEPLHDRLFTRNFLVMGSHFLSNAFRKNPSKKALDHSGLFKRSDGKIERVYFGQTNESYTKHQWQVMVDTLEEANRLTKQAGAQFVVLYIPRKFRIYRNHLDVKPGSFISTWTLNNLPGDLGKWCRINNIHYLDTTKALEASIKKGRHPYFVDDVHWNELGHKIAAEQLISYLKHNKVYPY